MINKHLIQTDQYLVLSRIFLSKRESRGKKCARDTYPVSPLLSDSPPFFFSFAAEIRSRPALFTLSILPGIYCRMSLVLLTLMSLDIIRERTCDIFAIYSLRKGQTKNERIELWLFQRRIFFFLQSMFA